MSALNLLGVAVLAFVFHGAFATVPKGSPLWGDMAYSAAWSAFITLGVWLVTL